MEYMGTTATAEILKLNISGIILKKLLDLQNVMQPVARVVPMPIKKTDI